VILGVVSLDGPAVGVGCWETSGETGAPVGL
jgi:hypothetical protein